MTKRPKVLFNGLVIIKEFAKIMAELRDGRRCRAHQAPSSNHPHASPMPRIKMPAHARHRGTSTYWPARGRRIIIAGEESENLA